LAPGRKFFILTSNVNVTSFYFWYKIATLPLIG
jgi:hypothetical protein